MKLEKKTSRTNLMVHWQSGIEAFNQADYWSAHEFWERGWLDLEGLEKKYIQGLIQSSGAFFLILEKKRYPAALRLVRASLEKLELVTQDAAFPLLLPRIEIPHLEKVLRFIQQNGSISLTVDPKQWHETITELKARMIILN